MYLQECPRLGNAYQQLARPTTDKIVASVHVCIGQCCAVQLYASHINYRKHTLFILNWSEPLND